LQACSQSADEQNRAHLFDCGIHLCRKLHVRNHRTH
jgi:hypothetical protein